MSKSFLLLVIVFMHSASAQNINNAKVSFEIFENGKVTSCNVQIRDVTGMYWYPDSCLVWKDFTGHTFESFPTGGRFTLDLPFGKYYYETFRGPAYRSIKDSFIINGQEQLQRWYLKKIIDLNKLHWWAGDTHIHRKLSDIPLLMSASDLNIGEVFTSWNNEYNIDMVQLKKSIQIAGASRFFDNTASEDERGGGALLFFNLTEPFDFRNQEMEYPPLANSIENVTNKNKSAWVDLEKPFWKDVPILLATQKINSIGIANNHMLKTGIFDTEGWGKKRDILKYPSPFGNAYYTQDLYYHVLNCGFRIPPSAGSASGILWNPVGYNRLYAYVEGKLTYNQYWSAVEKGKCFVTNGPLIICEANECLPGTIFQVSPDKNLHIKVTADIYSNDSIASIEIIKNGKIYASYKAGQMNKNRIDLSVDFDRSGWFLIRVIDTTNNNFRFASTAPFYVEESQAKKYVSATSCNFFLDWLNERETSLNIENPGHLRVVKEKISEARNFWENLKKVANAE